MAKRNQKKVSKQTLQQQYQTCPRANFFKRLGAYTYDLFALTALLMFAIIFAILVAIICNNFAFIDLSAYHDIADFLSQSSLFVAYLALVIIAFFAYFWCKSGQTIGMKICHLRVQNSDGSNISFTQALIRLATSTFGFGNFLALFKNRNAFQDLWAECEVVVLTKELSTWKGFTDKDNK